MEIDEIFKHARAMKEQLDEAQEALKTASVTGESGAGLVKVTLNGRHEALRVDIDPAVISDDRTVLEDLVAAAINDAVRRVEVMQKDRMSTLAQRLGLPPGINLPF